MDHLCESVNSYNVRWNLEKDLLDELVVAEVHPDGSIQVVEVESMYIQSSWLLQPQAT